MLVRVPFCSFRGIEILHNPTDLQLKETARLAISGFKGDALRADRRPCWAGTSAAILGGRLYDVDMDRAQEKIALLTLLHHTEPALRWNDIRQELLDGATPTEILEGPGLVGRDASEQLALAREDLSGWNGDGIQVLTPVDENYPAQLLSVHDFPLVLFGRGHVIHDSRSAAIVGSRDFSLGGQQFADRLATRLAQSDVTVVSGLAKGIDGTAHRAALRAGGRTVAIIGNGLNHVYPAEHRALQQAIADRGLVLSQFRPATRSSRQTFPQRNITMSAYSAMTVIVEAQENSGTRIQANAAIKHGRPLVLSQQVVDRTSWGQQYAAGRFDVVVVPDADQAHDAVLEILQRIHRPLQLAGV